MQNLQLSWMHLMEVAEAKYVQYADQHNTFIEAVGDTSSHWRQATLGQDTVLRMRIDRLTGSFERASRRHLFQLKELRSYLAGNEIWLMRLKAEGAPRRAIRGSWDARRTQFQTKMDRILSSQKEFEVFGPEYDRLSQRIPGMTDAPAILPPTPNPAPPAAVAPALPQ